MAQDFSAELVLQRRRRLRERPWSRTLARDLNAACRVSETTAADCVQRVQVSRHGRHSQRAEILWLHLWLQTGDSGPLHHGAGEPNRRLI